MSRVAGANTAGDVSRVWTSTSSMASWILQEGGNPPVTGAADGVGLPVACIKAVERGGRV
jgi:hypothetical protein